MLTGLKNISHILQPMQLMRWSVGKKKSFGGRSEHLAVNARKASLLQLFSTSHNEAETGRRQGGFAISSLLLPKSSMIFHSLEFRVNEVIAHQLARSTGRCNWVNGALICPWNSVLAQEVGPSPLSSWKTGHSNASRTFKWMPVTCQSSEGILATIYWVLNHFFYISR